ncbi:hypothetical protein Gasu2_04930 [Galdieria sulphuraria]|uniref:Uncharacterized protein n=1 Tax=Galdieria sulphuraria TaxID=130081 RepID=M2Y8Q8_GALSU|nr:uncharacterized protein Gasu_05310 [Galdieria sulphuraria]EME32448.1 hypothetical protein Gasu_05310 [Galdieria sulphuraria]GJD06055.1 hypothetical protein Gasu2_04930 [Galdieria sulphuraria]|eukprot:XP_005708968.1 hypothetical protein Gasu_05310 [Galdieria sulphuraria]
MESEQVVPELGEEANRVEGSFEGLHSSSHRHVKFSQDAVFELLGSQLTLRSPSSGTFCPLFRKKPPSGKRCAEANSVAPFNDNVYESSASIKQREFFQPQCTSRLQDEVSEISSRDPVLKRRKTELNEDELSRSWENVISENHKALSFPAPSPVSRYKSPLRQGNWHESWESARSLGADSVPSQKSYMVISRVKHIISMIVQRSTCLSLTTLDKWLTLMCNFIEFNADEYVLFLIMVKKYLVSDGQLLSLHDCTRPQKWERVLAVCAYFVVFLSEEFTGRIRRDLEDLMGPAFHFGKEQQSFLSVVDWKVNVAYKEFEKVHQFLLLEGNEYKLQVWQWLGFSLNELDSCGDLAPSVALKNTQRSRASLVRANECVTLSSGNNKPCTESTQEKKVPKIEANDGNCFGSSESITNSFISQESEEYQTVPC